MYTGNGVYRDTAAKMADYVADHLPEDGVPLWDYHLGPDKMLLGLVEHCDITADNDAEGLLKEGTAFVELGRADNMLSYRDYYYLEALMRSQLP